MYETTLASLAAMPQAYVRHAPGLAAGLAELELGERAPGSRARAAHVLTWLGTGGPFARAKAPKGGAEKLPMPGPDRLTSYAAPVTSLPLVFSSACPR